MNSIYIESEKILARKDIVEWLDGCGAKWAEYRTIFSQTKIDYDAVLFVNGHFENWGMLYGSGSINATHCQTPEQFCELIAGWLGIDKPVFGEPMQPFIDEMIDEMIDGKPIKGMAIEVSRLGEQDIKWIQNIYPSWNDHFQLCVCSKLEGEKFNYIDMCKFSKVKARGYTITDSPKVFMEYVAQQTGKEYDPERRYNPEEGLPPNLGTNEAIESYKNKIRQEIQQEPESCYPHKTYRILDSLDGIPLDKRFKLSEWIPPFGPKGLVSFISDGWFEKGYLISIDETHVFIRYGEGRSASIKITDGEWMRIV